MSKEDEIDQMLIDTAQILREVMKYKHHIENDRLMDLLNATKSCMYDPNIDECETTKKVYEGALSIKADTEKFEAWINKIIESTRE